MSAFTNELIAIVGESGTGKTRSVKGLPPEETFFTTVSGKKPSFKGWKKHYTPFNPETKKGNFYHIGSYQDYLPNPTTKSRGLLNAVSETMPHVKHLILDDFQYLMGFEFMDRAYEKGWDKFVEIGRHAFDVIRLASKLRPDLKVYIMCHEDTVKRPLGGLQRKIKTIGDMLDKQITLEGLFTFVLFTEVVKEVGKETPTFYFVTQSDGTTTAKSVEGVFDTYRIENDLGIVSKAIDTYNEVS